MAEEDLAVKTMRKRYEGLLMVRSKAIKGKGAWYWAHLEPTLVSHADTGVPKAVKLKCALCNAMFSASNPSRTASEHLKRGTCPNFSSTSALARPIAAAAQPPLPPPPPVSAAAAAAAAKARKRPSSAAAPPLAAAAAAAAAAAWEEAKPLLLSGGKEDLGALALLEDKVKRMKSPAAAAGQGLSREQAEAAMAALAEWVLEAQGSRLSLGSVEHPKLRSFMQQLGLPPLSRAQLGGPHLDARFEQVQRQSEERLRDALFFQLSADGCKRSGAGGGVEELVYLSLNLPNGGSLFCRAAPPPLSGGDTSALLEETLAAACGGKPERCAGVVADVDKRSARALAELEARRPWMVNVTCLAQVFAGFLSDVSKRLPLYRTVLPHCRKLAAFFGQRRPARALLQRLQREAYGGVRPLGGHPAAAAGRGWAALLLPVEVARSARALQAAAREAAAAVAAGGDEAAEQEARAVAEIAASPAFWAEVAAAAELVEVVAGMVAEVERERPLVSACLPLWEELRGKVAAWCGSHGRGAGDEAALEAALTGRLTRHYHPAWAAALLLDPLYLVRDAAGSRYLPFKLSPEQDKDCDQLVMRLVARDEAHVALAELMKWRSEGLDPLYAQAVQLRQADPASGRLRTVSAQSRRLVWETGLQHFKLLGKVAARLIFLHATSARLKGWAAACLPPPFAAGTASMTSASMTSASTAAGGPERAAKLMYVAANALLERPTEECRYSYYGAPEDESEEEQLQLQQRGWHHQQQQQQQQHQQLEAAAAAAGSSGGGRKEGGGGAAEESATAPYI